MSGLKTVDVARRAGCSVQQVRNLERDGVLPPVARTASGYRVYAEAHVAAALAYRLLAAGAGPAKGRAIVRAAHGDTHQAPALLDAAHARLHAERTGLARAVEAARAIAGEPIAEVRASDALTVSELAAALGVRTSTLRHWEGEGLVTAERAGPRRARRYSPAQVRDARVVHQLRLAGYRIGPLRALVPELLRSPGELASVLAAREAALAARSRALLDGAAALSAVLAAGDEGGDA
ncbi:MerR family transcriptional regulator [Kitasatospora sp. NPDC048365]|uniref:MerR family transcriptional regulator n=1 Tax=Kitasatospora sp. NPDC048365 TaxID=3364050 RepID=UPI003723DB6C